jgi:sulfur relay (sulfurtransferase) complex TusBCD TusD component (DsrE family)
MLCPFFCYCVLVDLDNRGFEVRCCQCTMEGRGCVQQVETDEKEYIHKGLGNPATPGSVVHAIAVINNCMQWIIVIDSTP